MGTLVDCCDLSLPSPPLRIALRGVCCRPHALGGSNFRPYSGRPGVTRFTPSSTLGDQRELDEEDVAYSSIDVAVEFNP